MTNAPVSNAPEITVSELSGAIKRAIEEGFGFVRVRGEVSGYRGPHASGHAYFSLKDANARIDAVIWRSAFARMKVKPQEGLEVVATGRLTTFPGKSAYQLVIDQLELAGVGALMAMLEARRKKLAEEGLFDPKRKRKIPFLPKVVGVVTSPTGAVIRDILHRLSDRFPLHVVLWPVRVQGETSAAEITAAIDGFNRLGGGRFRATAGRAHRRARRRLARRPHELQRGDRAARGGAERDPGDRGGRARDRLDAARPCRRSARADPDGCGRIRRAGSRRSHRSARRCRRAPARRLLTPSRSQARRPAGARPRAAEPARNSSRARGRDWTGRVRRLPRASGAQRISGR